MLVAARRTDRRDDCVYADVRLEGWSDIPAGSTGCALAVPPRMRGPGMGEALVRHCVERLATSARRRSGHTISLLTDTVGLYQRLGFVRCPEFDLRRPTSSPPERGRDGPTRSSVAKAPQEELNRPRSSHGLAEGPGAPSGRRLRSCQEHVQRFPQGAALPV